MEVKWPQASPYRLDLVSSQYIQETSGTTPEPSNVHWDTYHYLVHIHVRD